MSWGMVSEKHVLKSLMIEISATAYEAKYVSQLFPTTRADDGSRCYWNVYDIFLSSSALVAVFIINKVCLVESAFWPFRPADKAGTNTEADCSYIDISTFTTY